MRKFFNVLILCSLILPIGCTSATQKRAEADFARVDVFIRQGELSTAMELLDSMMIWYKEDYGTVGNAIRRRDLLASDYHREALQKAETKLATLESQIPSLARDFRLTPGEAGRPGLYEHKRQTVQGSWNRTFLKINILENGEVWLTSHYYGKSWIDHVALRVYDSENYVVSDTIPLDDPWNRKVEDLGDRWETIEFREGTDAGIIQFIADNYLKSVKVRFNGKSFQYIVLESYDKEAFHKGWELAQVLKEVDGLRQTINRHRNELARLGKQVGS